MIKSPYTKFWLVLLWLGGHGFLIEASTTETTERPVSPNPNLRTNNLSRQLDYVPVSMQSGPDSGGSSYAASSYIDPTTQTLHIVGTTYGNWWSKTGAEAGGTDHPSCFYAIAQLPTSKVNTLTWIYTQMIGTGNAEEGCRGLLLDQIKEHLYLIGYSDVTNALLSDLYDTGSLSADNNIKQLGTIVDYKSATNGLATLEGGRVLSGSRVNYPVAITGLPNSNSFYTVSMVSSSTTKNLLWGEGIQMDPGEFFHYGTNYMMMIQEFIKDPLPSDASATDTIRVSVKPTMSETLGTDSPGGVYVSAMLQLPDRLIVTGFTTGFGYGLNSTNGGKMDVGNLDGFVTQLSLTDLKLVPDVSPYRIASGSPDFVTGACYSPADPGYFYVTGFTAGSFLNSGPASGSTRGYIMKLSTQGNRMWVQEFEPTLNPSLQYYVAEAISCAVTSDGQTVYVAGNVDSGGSFGNEFGERDVWVAQLNVIMGDIAFIKQIGSDKDDFVAHRGGIQVDANNDAVLIGNTNGQMFRPRDATTEPFNMDEFLYDVFVITFRKNDGSHAPPIGDSATLPPTPQSIPAPRPAPPPVSKPSSADSKDAPTDQFPIRSALLLALIVLPFMFCFYRALSHCMPGGPRIKRDVATHRRKVLGYLHDFDVEDIELKHSATGGWHCSYLNDLAKGINKQADEDLFSLASRRSRTSSRRGSTNTASASVPEEDEISFSLDKPRGVPSTVAAGASSSRPSMSIERFSDEIFTINDEDDDLMSFGSSRSARRERRNLKAASLYSDSPSTKKKAARSRASNQSILGTSTGTGSLLANTATGGSSRSSRAKERWENREII